MFFCVCELIKLFILCNLGQYVHLPSLVHAGDVVFLGFDCGFGRYVSLFDVNKSLRFGRLLKPINGLSGNIFVTPLCCL